MSNFDLTFYKVYIYAKGWSGINLGASQDSCAHPIVYNTYTYIFLINRTSRLRLLGNIYSGFYGVLIGVLVHFMR